MRVAHVRAQHIYTGMVRVHWLLISELHCNSGLIVTFLFSNCFKYILEKDLSDSIETGWVLSFCQTKSN